jgi:SAM-dependent methyltransferase
MVSLAALAADPAARLTASEWLLDFPGPLALVWGHRDPLMTAADFAAQERELPYARIWRTEAGHFVQEEEPAVIAEALAWTAALVGIAADPEGAPENLLPGIGRGDFVEVGRTQVRRLIEHGGLRPDDSILDLGCGLGRTARALRDFLSESGRYHGVDVVRDIVRWCQQNLTRVDRRLRFHCAPVHNELYNPGGTSDARSYRFPFEDSSFDFVIAESLFTHLASDDARHYLAEVARVLRPGGTLCMSVFLLDDDARRAIAERKSDHRFDTRRGVEWVEHPEQPLLAVALEEPWLRAALAGAGLDPAGPTLPGAWRGTGGTVSYQDTLVLTRRYPRRGG